MGVNDVGFGFNLFMKTNDPRINPKSRLQEFSIHDWENLLKSLVLCLNCDAYFDISSGKGKCWSCNTSHETVDDSHGMGVNAVLAKISGEEDSEAIYIVGENGDGWAYAEWCNLIGKEFDVADEFWNL